LVSELQTFEERFRPLKISRPANAERTAPIADLRHPERFEVWSIIARQAKRRPGQAGSGAASRAALNQFFL
jgi:hypothetical protein